MLGQIAPPGTCAARAGGFSDSVPRCYRAAALPVTGRDRAVSLTARNVHVEG